MEQNKKKKKRGAAELCDTFLFPSWIWDLPSMMASTAPPAQNSIRICRGKTQLQIYSEREILPWKVGEQHEFYRKDIRARSSVLLITLWTPSKKPIDRIRRTTAPPSILYWQILLYSKTVFMCQSLLDWNVRSGSSYKLQTGSEILPPPTLVMLHLFKKCTAGSDGWWFC